MPDPMEKRFLNLQSPACLQGITRSATHSADQAEDLAWKRAYLALACAANDLRDLIESRAVVDALRAKAEAIRWANPLDLSSRPELSEESLSRLAEALQAARSQCVTTSEPDPEGRG